jgi:ABC-type transport system substrate-binding protein
MKNFIYLILTTVILYSCGSGQNKQNFEHAGGVFKMCLSDTPTNFIPRDVTDVHSATLMYQVMEGLVSFNPEDLKIQAQIAKSWKISKDNLTYTFEIRNNVLFHKSKTLSGKNERLLSLEDVINSFEIACKKDKNGNPSAAYTSFFQGTIKGVDAFHEGKAKNISGLSFKENTLTIKLSQADANFLNKLANVNASISSKKAFDAGEESLMIGTGPFVFSGIKEVEEQKTILLEKNEDYYLSDSKGNSLPYLDALELIIESKKLEELAMFEKGETHFITTLPTSRISSMLEGKMKDFNAVPPVLILRNNPLLATNYYFFNMNDKRFQDVKVRQAFNYAVNRNKLTQFVLKGQAYENGVYGIVPPLSAYFRGYDFKSLKEVSYDYDPAKAKQLLKEAGYPEGAGFGSVDLRVNIGDIHSAVAEDFSSQIKQVLGINVNIDASSFEQKNRDASNGKGHMFRSAWFADYVSPESFLMNFYGKNVPESIKEPSVTNQSRYKNAKFDELFESAKKVSKINDRLTLFAEAEKELMKDPPIIVLWYNGDIQLVYSKVRNFHENPLNYFIFREVYFKDWTKTEYENRAKK